MDNGIGTFLYILFMILVVAASVYKSNAKKNATAAKKPNRPPFFDMEKDVDYTVPDSMGMYIPGAPQTNDTEIMQEEMVVELDREAEKEEIKSEGHAVFDETELTIISDDMAIKDEISASELLDNKNSMTNVDADKEDYHFNLKRAVIFSEILNRKNF